MDADENGVKTGDIIQIQAGNTTGDVTIRTTLRYSSGKIVNRILETTKVVNKLTRKVYLYIVNNSIQNPATAVAQIETANRIWRQAGIEFEIAKNGESDVWYVNGPGLDYIDITERSALMDEDPGDGFEIYFVDGFQHTYQNRTLRGLNTLEGIMINGLGIANGKTTAHELGHALARIGDSLHVRNRYCIMYSGEDSTPSKREDLTAGRADHARDGYTSHE